jgi:uncharacterized protein
MRLRFPGKRGANKDHAACLEINFEPATTARVFALEIGRVTAWEPGRRVVSKEQQMSDTATDTTTKIVWFEIPAGDTEQARSFYGDLFGWRFQPFDGQDYHVSYEAGGAVVDAAEQNGVKIYFGVDDIDAAIARVRELGGHAGEKEEIPNVGWYANGAHVDGNPIGLYQNAAGA